MNTLDVLEWVKVSKEEAFAVINNPDVIRADDAHFGQHSCKSGLHPDQYVVPTKLESVFSRIAR